MRPDTMRIELPEKHRKVSESFSFNPSIENLFLDRETDTETFWTWSEGQKLELDLEEQPDEIDRFGKLLQRYRVRGT